MRIGLFNPYYFSKAHAGGTEKVMSLLHKGLTELGIEAKIFPELDGYGSLYNPLFRRRVVSASRNDFDIIHSHKPEIGFEIPGNLITTFHTLKHSYAKSLPFSPQKILSS